MAEEIKAYVSNSGTIFRTLEDARKRDLYDDLYKALRYQVEGGKLRLEALTDPKYWRPVLAVLKEHAMTEALLGNHE